MSNYSLFFLLLLPFVGAVITPFLRDAARLFSLLVAFLTFVLSVLVSLGAGSGTVAWGGDANPLVLRDIGFSVSLAVDGISMWLLLLTTAITPLVILSTGKEVDEQPNARWYYTWMLVLLGALIGSFIAADGLLFYFFFELTLVPSLMLISIWGGPERRQAAGKFFIYTFAGSVFLLIGLIYLGAKAGSFEITKLVAAAQNPALVPTEVRYWLGLAFLVGFLVKTPVFPLNTWQPNTYAQSPTGAAILLAAVMSKLGTYGLLRLTLPIGFIGAPGAASNEATAHLVTTLCLISIVYGGLIAWVQKDMAKIMAYSSVSHLGLCVLAIFAKSTIGLQGALFYMVAHGLSTAAIFMIIGAIKTRTGTRDISEVSGLFKPMPILGTLLVIFVMASIGLPITAGFVGEFLSLQGVMNSYGLCVTLVAATGVILGAVYMLHMVAKIGFGPLKLPEGAEASDLNCRELTALAPLVLAIFAVGILPTGILNSFKTDVVAIHTKAAVIDTTPQFSEEDVFKGK